VTPQEMSEIQDNMSGEEFIKQQLADITSGEFLSRIAKLRHDEEKED
jgi:hypothetical protein